VSKDQASEIDDATCPQCGESLAARARFCSSCGSETSLGSRETEVISTRITAEGSGPADSFIGKVLDSKYELLARLGAGGAGTVYRARRLHIGDEVAVKVLNPEYVLDQTAAERFRREARSAAMIRHANVVTIHDFSESGLGGPAYIVMELVRGTSLREILKREGRMKPERAVALMHDVCAGVAVAHRQGLVHRDLKPDNVIVEAPEVESEREIAKVVDFGIAKLRGATTEFNLTQTGATVGTPFYMSPEQWHGKQLDARSDVYSLGAMLYEMLAGTPPFNATTLPELIYQQLNEVPPRFGSSLSVPPALERICRRALAKKPEERPSDASVFSREIQAALTSGVSNAGSPGPSLEQPTISASASSVPTLALSKQRSSPIKWIIAGGSVLLVLIVLAGAAFFSLKRFIDARRTANANTNSAVTQKPPSDSNTEAPNTDNSGNTTPLDGQANLVGKWTGTYGLSNNAATMMINEYKEGKFSGVIDQREVRLAFTGTIDAQSRRVTMKETQVLRGSGWSLGENAGEISADGRKMSGTGSDAIGGAFGISYQWSFSK
jgi:eukaryotic-like serine/threonine-protein kinase